MNEKLKTWGEVCDAAGIDPSATSRSADVERVIYAPNLSFPTGDVALKNQGFSKLVRRDDGVYENVTARDGQSKIVSADNPAAGLGLPD